MIKCEVDFENNMIELNEYQIIQGNDFQDWDIYKDDRLIEYFENLEEAIKYCMEN